MPNHSLNNTTFPSLNVYLKSEEASLSFSSSHKQSNLKTQINQSKRPDVQTLAPPNYDRNNTTPYCVWDHETKITEEEMAEYV